MGLTALKSVKGNKSRMRDRTDGTTIPKDYIGTSGVKSNRTEGVDRIGSTPGMKEVKVDQFRSTEGVGRTLKK